MKKLLNVFLYLCLIIGLVACTSDDKENANTVKIGWYGPLSGAAAEVGINGINAVKIAVEQINAVGGINGKQIKLVSYDDEGSAETSVKVVTRLIEQDNVVAIVGSHLSSSVLSSSDITEDSKIVMVGTGTSSIWTNVGLKYTFRGTACSNQFNDQAYDAMIKMGATKVATICGDTEYAQTCTTNIIKYINDNPDMEIVASESWTTGDTDYSGQLIKIVNANPDALYIVGGGEDVGKVIAQARQQGYEGYIYGVEPFADTNAMKMAGEAFEDCIFSCAYFIPASIEAALTSQEKDFLTAYDAMFEKLPTAEVAYRAYDSMMLLATAMEQTTDFSGDAIREAFLKMNYTGIGGDFDFSADTGEGLDQVKVYIYKDGAHHDFYKWLEK